jgi:hypothetical protein
MKEAAVAKNDNIPESLMEPLKHLVQSNLVSLKAKLKSNPQQIQTYLQKNLKAFNALNSFQQTVIVGVTISIISGSIVVYNNQTRMRRFLSTKKKVPTQKKTGKQKKKKKKKKTEKNKKI